MTQQARPTGVREALRVATSLPSLLALAALAGQIVLLFAYLIVTETPVTNTTRVLLPLVWTTVAVWFVAYLATSHGHADRTESPRRHRSAALAVGGVYLIALAALGGLVGLTDQSAGLTVVPATPGWGPIVMASLPPLHFVVVPYEVVGYLALSYGVYRALRATSSGALAGLLGLFSCVGCTLPLVGAALGVVGGTASTLQPGALSIHLSTAIFVGTVAVLTWTIPTRNH